MDKWAVSSMQRGATSAFTSARTPTWFPPASVAEGDKELFGVDKDEFPPNFWIPPRLKDKSAELIEVSANLYLRAIVVLCTSLTHSPTHSRSRFSLSPVLPLYCCML